jgi:hypothetical protein
MLSAVQDAAKRRTEVVTDIPGAFLNAKLDKLVQMVLVGKLVDLLIAAVPGVYKKYATTNHKGKTMLYVILTRALYGCLKLALQFWKHLTANLLKAGYKLNIYDTCVANKVINGAQCTITWPVDDLKISHVDIRKDGDCNRKGTYLSGDGFRLHDPPRSVGIYDPVHARDHR